MNDFFAHSFFNELEKIASYSYTPLEASFDALAGALTTQEPAKGALGGVLGGYGGFLVGSRLGTVLAKPLKKKSPLAAELLPLISGGAASFGGMTALSRALGGGYRSPFKSREKKIDRNQYTSWLNQPENLRRINELMEENAQAMYKKPLSQLSDREWKSSYSKSRKSMKAIYQQSKEKKAYITPGGRPPRVMGANYMQGPVSAMQANRMTRKNMLQPMQSANPVSGSVTAISQPAMAKQAGFSPKQKALLGVANTVRGRGYRRAGVDITDNQHRRIKELYNSQVPEDRLQARELMRTLAPSVPESGYSSLFRKPDFNLAPAKRPPKTDLQESRDLNLRQRRVNQIFRRMLLMEDKNPALYSKLEDLAQANKSIEMPPFRQIAEPYLKKQAEVTYRGITFPGYNKPIASNRKGKKKMVLVKRGDKVRIVHFGQKGYEDFTQHKDKKRRKNYLTRSAGIRNKSGQLTKDDPFSPNYWARRKLW